MKIAISTLVNSGRITGVGKYIIYLIKYLQKIDQINEYYIIVNKEFNRLMPLDSPNFKKIIVNIPDKPWLLMRGIYTLWQNLFINRLLKKYSIDVIHLPNAVPLFKTNNIPYVVTIHDVIECSIQQRPTLRRKIRKYASTSSAKKAQHIITVSEFSKEEIRTILKIAPNKITVTYPGTTIDNSFDTVKINPVNPYLLHVGGASANKNVDLLIESFKKIRWDGKLIIVGDHSEYFSLAEIEDLKAFEIYFIGYLTDKELVTYYNNAFALIYPSLYEGFGLPITEAMSCGTPVITSNRSSMPEVGGDAVAYVDPESVESIQSAMERLLNDEEYRQDLIQKGLQRYKMFDWAETARKTIEVYEAAALQ